MDWGGFTRSLRNGFWGRKCWKSKSGIRAETLVAQGFRELAESYCLGISAPHGKIQTIGGRIRETSTPHFWNKKRHFFRIFGRTSKNSTNRANDDCWIMEPVRWLGYNLCIKIDIGDLKMNLKKTLLRLSDVTHGRISNAQTFSDFLAYAALRLSTRTDPVHYKERAEQLQRLGSNYKEP